MSTQPGAPEVVRTTWLRLNTLPLLSLASVSLPVRWGDTLLLALGGCPMSVALSPSPVGSTPCAVGCAALVVWCQRCLLLLGLHAGTTAGLAPVCPSRDKGPALQSTLMNSFSE